MANFLRWGAFALATATLFTSSASAVVVIGTPSFKTGPATASFTNWFAPLSGGFFPTSDFNFAYSSTIVSSDDPTLVGRSLSLGIDTRSNVATFAIDGDHANAFGSVGSSGAGNVSINNIEDFICDPVTGTCDLGFREPYSAFQYDGSGELDIRFTLHFALPERTGYEYCFTDISGLDCRFSGIAGLTELEGRPVATSGPFNFVEGSVTGATITFGTPAPSPVPLPAGIWLMAAALGGLGAARKFRHRAA